MLTRKPKKENQQDSSLIDTRVLSSRASVNTNRAGHFRHQIESIGHLVYSQVSSCSSFLRAVDANTFNRYLWPIVSSSAASMLGDYVLGSLNQYVHGNDENGFIYKLALGSLILSYSALHRVTEREFKSVAELSAAVASEVVAITYMYSSIFQGTKILIGDTLSENYSLVASLGTSAILVPGSISWLTQNLQKLLVRNEYKRGAQRSDTAVISSGLSGVANFYFQLNHFLVRELISSSRLFQLGLISHNINSAEHLIQKFRNMPALLADLTPGTIKKLRVQQEKLNRDFEYNHTQHQVLRFTSHGPEFFSVKRYQLRRGDLVHCDHDMNLSSVPVSGEIIALQCNEEGQFLRKPEQGKFSVNLKAQNGEDVWIEHQSKLSFGSTYNAVDLHAVHEGKQPGVLVGDKLNIYGKTNVFIQIMPETELILSSDYEKKAVINQIIAQRKQKTVFYAILASLLTAGILNRDFASLPAESLRFMFTLFQAMIPFSESFLRETVNSGLMKKLNKRLVAHPFETIDALRIVDFQYALSGYYKERFPQGVAIISDKTGTLTTNEMNVLGLWTREMPEDVETLLKEKKNVLPGLRELLESFELFCCAHTNNKKDSEPEEFAILEFYKSHLKKQNCMQVIILGHNHFKKIIDIEGFEKQLEIFQLGLYRSLGGRLTLVDEGNNKYLVFCGVPRLDAFNDMPLLKTYTAMHSRTGVLSRDWCIARTRLSEGDFIILKERFSNNDKQGIESFVRHHETLLNSLRHYATFIIDNPVKKGVKQFIKQCREKSVPIFVATGDTAKAAENIARVLYPGCAKKIKVVRSNTLEQVIENFEAESSSHDSTLIFSGINSDILACFKKIMARPQYTHPVIIFAEMSTEEKGMLARFLQENQFFVVANGDGSNDVMMMKNSNLVIGHYADDATFAPGVGQLSNVSEKQVQSLLGSKNSIYEMLDIEHSRSLFFKQFSPLANSQEKPSVGMGGKFIKVSMDMAKAIGVLHVQEMYQQHWFSVGFDLIWLWIVYHEINLSTHSPLDNKHIGASYLLTQTMGIVFLIAGLEALMNYALFGESTNLSSMLIMLGLLPLVLRSVFSAFEAEHDNINPARDTPVEIESQKPTRRSVFDYFGTLFRSSRTIGNKEPIIEAYHYN